MNTNMFHVTRLWVIWLIVAVAGLFGSQTNVAAEMNAHSDAPVTVSAEFTVAEDSSQGTLSITASIREGFHIYALTQPKPFIATRIHVDESDRFDDMNFSTSSCKSTKVRSHGPPRYELLLTCRMKKCAFRVTYSFRHARPIAAWLPRNTRSMRSGIQKE